MPTEPRRMNFILIGLCTKGEVMYQLDTQKQIIKAGDILIVSDRHVVDSYQRSPDMEGLCMMLSVNFYCEIIQNVSDVSALFLFSRQHPVMRLEQREIDTFKEYFQVIKQKIGDEGNHFRKDLVKTLLLAMFYDLSNIIYRVKQDDKPLTRAEIIFTKFIKLVEKNFREERRVSWYAQQICITPKYLSETVKNVSHRTPNEWIDNYIILELRVLLKNSTKTIKEIAEELKFPNQSFLGKFFKEHVGMSPSQYRKS
ncbi:MAG: AraC family transcriptional regulator [Prevotella sp.]|nr:AraC family transcriptional regulator [Prevotella sp.]